MKNKVIKLTGSLMLIVLLLLATGTRPNSPGDEKPPELGYEISTTLSL